MGTRRCGEILRGRKCPRCLRQFFICQHCDRGHVYCCRRCSFLSRYEKLRVYRNRYRRSQEGREQHQDMERSRRRRQTLRQKSVGDQTSFSVSSSAMVGALMRVAAAVAAFEDIGREEAGGEDNRCAICGRRGILVRFGEEMRKRASSGTGFRFSP